MAPKRRPAAAATAGAATANAKAGTAPVAAHDAPHVVVQSRDRGRVVLATRAIPAGTIIHSELVRVHSLCHNTPNTRAAIGNSPCRDGRSERHRVWKQSQHDLRKKAVEYLQHSLHGHCILSLNYHQQLAMLSLHCIYLIRILHISLMHLVTYRDLALALVSNRCVSALCVLPCAATHRHGLVWLGRGGASSTICGNHCGQRICYWKW